MADLVAQKRQEQISGGADKNKAAPAKFDAKRNIAFTVYGAVYQGMAQEFIYNHMYAVWFGVGTNVKTVLSKVLFDLLIQVSTLCICPSFDFFVVLVFVTSLRNPFNSLSCTHTHSVSSSVRSVISYSKLSFLCRQHF